MRSGTRCVAVSGTRSSGLVANRDLGRSLVCVPSSTFEQATLRALAVAVYAATSPFETCLNCQAPGSLGNEEQRVMIAAGKSLGTFTHHHRTVRCGQCGQ